MSVGIVIPVLDDLIPLRDLLERVSGWSEQPDEITVVAGAQSAELERLCRTADCALYVTQANRGAQLDQGARASHASILWFLHADAWPPDDGVLSIEQSIEAGAEGGFFRFEFQGRPAFHKWLIARLVAIRVALGGMPYGDQGLFARRDIYLDCGGFAHQPLFEEVTLIKQLRRRGKFRALESSIRVATRRWDKDGWWKRTLHNRWLALCYMLGMPIEKLSAAYRSAPPLDSAHEHIDR